MKEENRKITNEYSFINQSLEDSNKLLRITEKEKDRLSMEL